MRKDECKNQADDRAEHLSGVFLCPGESCGRVPESSYTVLQGKNYLDDVSPRELTAWEYESLKQLFQWMDGDWVGDGRTMKCTGPEDRG